jgi:hypothetical protein
MPEGDEDFVRALRPVVEALGATMVPERSARPGDFPVEWNGAVATFVRSAELHSALGRLVGSVERELGVDLAEMSRSEKQAAVRRLDEQGAFLLRGAVDDVAHLMGVSRVTLYTYLNTVHPKSS